jgi:hypothetical protein
MDAPARASNPRALRSVTCMPTCHRSRSAWRNVILPGDSRPMIRAADYLSLLAQHTYCDDRVYP